MLLLNLRNVFFDRNVYILYSFVWKFESNLKNDYCQLENWNLKNMKNIKNQCKTYENRTIMPKSQCFHWLVCLFWLWNLKMHVFSLSFLTFLTFSLSDQLLEWVPDRNALISLGFSFFSFQPNLSKPWSVSWALRPGSDWVESQKMQKTK